MPNGEKYIVSKTKKIIWYIDLEFRFPSLTNCGTHFIQMIAIIEKWPFRFKLRPDQPGAQEEFDRLLSGGVLEKEGYMEWKRI